MNMAEASDNHPVVENNAEGDDIPGRRSIERAIEERFALKLKGITLAEGRDFEFQVVAREGLDDNCVRKWEHGKTTQLKESLNVNKFRLDSMLTGGDFKEDNHQKNDDNVQGCRKEIKMNIHQGHHADSAGETSEEACSVAENRVQKLPQTPNYQTLRDLMALRHSDIHDTSVKSASAVDNSHARNFSWDASSVTAYKPSMEEGTPRVAEKLNLEKQETELEAYILDRLSGLQPSFRTLYEPRAVDTSSTTAGSSERMTGQEPGKSKWKKKIEDVVAKVTNSGSKKQQESPVGSILYETEVKGILKMKWEEERKQSQAKQRTKWERSWICCCCPGSKSTGRNMEDMEIHLEEYNPPW